MKHSRMLSDLIDELIALHNEEGNMPVVSSSNEENIFTTDVFISVEPSSQFSDCLYLNDRSAESESWTSFKHSDTPIPAKVLHVGANAPTFGEPGQFVNGKELPQMYESFDERHFLDQMEQIQKNYEKALE